MFVMDTSSNSASDSSEEPEDKLDSDYDPLWDQDGFLPFFLPFRLV